YYYQDFKFANGLSAQQIELYVADLSEYMEADMAFLSDSHQKENNAKHWLTAAEHLERIAEYQRSKAYADKALTMYGELLKLSPKNNSYVAGIADSQLLKARLLHKMTQLHVSADLCQNARDMLSTIATNNRTPRYTITYAKVLDCLGQLH